MENIENKSVELMKTQIDQLNLVDHKTLLYGVKDLKTGKFATPFVAPNVQVAKRSLKAAMNDLNSIIAQFPEDFSLWLYGYYDENTAELVTNNVFVCNAIDLKKGDSNV